MRVKKMLILLLVNIVFANNYFLQATTQVAATNFDYVSTFYFNSSLEGFYNFNNTPFILGAGLGSVYGTTDNLYQSDGGVYYSNFNIPYITLFGGVLFNPLPKIKNITIFRVAQSLGGSSTCTASFEFNCNPVDSNVNLIQIGVRNSTMYFFTDNLYLAFNAGADINHFTFSPSFSSAPNVSVSSRTYNNPGPNIGFSIGTSF